MHEGHSHALQPADFESVDAYVAAVKALPEAPAHADNAAMAAEHKAIHDLCSRSAATHVAVAPGNWNSALTWHKGRVPTNDARVLIPEVIAVTCNHQDAADLFTIRNDGVLRMDGGRLNFDTMLVGGTGHFDIGTPAAPGNSFIQFNLRTNRISFDPWLAGGGIVAHGSTALYGAFKTTFVKIAGSPKAGDNTILLGHDVVNWNVGDRIVVPGTRPVTALLNSTDAMARSEDEERIIEEISGRSITLNAPLTFDHPPCSFDPTLTGYVANFSRSVTFQSRSTDIKLRGHLQLMHSQKVDIQYCAFNDMGRTDKRIRSVPATGTQGDANVQGRYVIHGHHTGLDPTSVPAKIIGNAVWKSPGWGITQHGSFMEIEDNAVYDCAGTCIVAEDGDEIGSWRRNIAIRSRGVPTTGHTQPISKTSSDVSAFDLGRNGNGYWFQSRLVIAEDNIACGFGNAGFVYMHRGGPPDFNAENFDFPEALRGYTSGANPDFPSIRHFRRNEAFSGWMGFEVVKADPWQNHAVRTVFEENVGWEVGKGTDIEYTAHYLLLRNRFFGRTRPRYVGAPAKGNVGIHLGPNNFDTTIVACHFDNFLEGIEGSRSQTPNYEGMIQGRFWYAAFGNTFANISGPTIDGFTGADDIVSASVPPPVEASISVSASPSTWTSESVINGTQTDSSGANFDYTPGGSRNRILREHMMRALVNPRFGYRTAPDGRKLVLFPEYFSDRVYGTVWRRPQDVEIYLGSTVSLPAGAINNGPINLSNPAPATPAPVTLTTNIGAPVSHTIPNLSGIDQPRNGRVVRASTSPSFTYVPKRGFSGEDSFQFWVTNGHGKHAHGVVNVTVHGGVVVEPPPPPPPPPPPVEEPPPPTTDPRDAEIAALTAQLSAVNTKISNAKAILLGA